MSNLTTILILGGGTMQIPAIQIAKKKGWRVIIVDGNPDAEAKHLADIFENIDLKNKEKIAEMARMYKKRSGLDGVFTAGTDFSTSVAFVAENLGLPGIRYETAVNATDKSRMRDIFREKGVPSPKYLVLTDSDDPIYAIQGIGFPLVFKPVDNMGARGVRKVSSKKELESAFQSAIGFSRSGYVIAEEYMEGPELSLDALVWEGKITICGIADRHIYFPPYFVEMGHTMPTILPKDTVDQAVSVFKQGIRSLGIDIGAAKGDIKITSRGPMVGEIAARLSGGYMSGWTYPYSSGVEVTEAALNIAIGEPPGDLYQKKNETSAERAFISIPGKIRSITGFENALSMPKIKAGFIRVGQGKEVVFPKNNVEKCGNIISLAGERDTAIRRAEQAVSSIFIRLEPDNDATERFLFKHAMKNVEGPASAYEIIDERNRSILAKMCGFKKRSALEGIDEIAVIPLPNIEEEHGRDWHGKSLNEAFMDFVSISGVSVEHENACHALVLGSVFWKAFLKGGVQAGLYVIDTVLSMRDRNGDLAARLKSWVKRK